MIFNNKPNSCIKQDGKEYWISRSCAVAGLVILNVNDEDYILVVKRGKGAADYQGYYCLPCGYIDYDESAYEAFTREVYEETGIELTPDKNLLQHGKKEPQPIFVDSNPSGNRQNITLFYEYYFKSNKIIKTDLSHNEPNEIEEAIWIKINQVDLFDFCFGHDKIIKKYY